MSSDDETTCSESSDRKLPPKSTTTTTNNNDDDAPPPWQVIDINNNDESDVAALENTAPSSVDDETIIAMNKDGAPEVLQPSPPGATRFSPDAKDLASAPRKKEYDSDDGYETDDGPFYDAVDGEGIQDFEEEAVIESADDIAEKTTTNNELPSANVGSFITIKDDAIDSMKVADMKAALIERGLVQSGNKATLKERLKKAIKEKVRIVEVVKVPDVLKGFSEGAHWRELVPDERVVEEPINTFKARAPTIPEEDHAFVPVKHNYLETFERPEFTGEKKVAVHFRNGQVKRKDGNIIYETVSRKTGSPRSSWLKKLHLTNRSHPIEFFEAFLPVTDKMYPAAKCSLERWTSNTNFKAMLSFAGQKGYPYPDCTPFTVDEIKKHLGIYILNGLSPSPRVEMKFNPQSIDEINGNDFVFRSFGPNALRRHKHFKAFFSIQDPRIIAPDRSSKPNWKVEPLLKLMKVASHEAWDLGEVFSIDEQTIGFQGNHKDNKLRITYKAEGDGFQCDALCEGGYTLSFYFRNEPAPAKYLSVGMSPLHSRVMALFDCLKDKYHRCGMDNLYMSAKFARNSFNHPNKVLIAGVTRKGMRGLPQCVMQEEAKNRSDQLKVRGTVKAAILEGDPLCPSLIATSVYDTKPVHFLSMSCNSINWITKERRVFNVDSGGVEGMRFLRLNINDSYNNEMGHVDVSDQLRNYYRFDQWLRKRKWWWSIKQWGLGVLLVNSFIIYKKVMEESGTPVKDCLSQYEFRRLIAMAWIGPAEHDPRRSKASSNTTFNSPTFELRKRKRIEESGSRRSVRICIANSALKDNNKNKAHRACDNSLQPDGKLRCRLRRDLHHWPAPAKNHKQRCCLHRWAAEIEVKAQVIYCHDCNVHLCVSCFKAFHTVPNIVEKKEALKELFDIEKEHKKSRVDENKKKKTGLNDYIIQSLFDSPSTITMHDI
jgi:Transposase IS4/SAP domain